ncbi:MAG TPA: DUF1592 domain-containing protein [Polyangiaceae bacterium]
MTGKIQGWAKAELLCAILGVAALAGCTGQIGAGSLGAGTGSNVAPPGGGAGSVGATGMPATDPGRVTMHRLNLAEYDNTMRDLLGITTHPSTDFNFPADDRGSDFDNTADVLTVSPLHLSSYNAAATALVAAALTDTTQRARLLSCDITAGGATCARTALEAFVPRAWRREATSAEIDSLMALVTVATSKGDSAEAGLKLALRAALLSASFMYRPELDPAPASLTPHPLGEYELASRMSYFLWSSMPDDALFAAAKAGNLHVAANLTSQVSRMLADPKAQALVDNFAGQWLFTRLVDDATPDPTLFPAFDASLRSAFKAETQMLFHEFAFNGLPADQLLTAPFTFVNDRLAKFYGLPAVGSDQMMRVDLTNNTERRGLLSQGGLLLVNSHPDRTSPVRRGKYVLSELLCTDIPPPPPTVNTKIVADTTGAKTLRQVLEAHIVDPSCASCHKLMDPIGFGMENYDAIGAYRTTDNSLPVDASGTLPSGESFNGLAELTPLIAKNPAFPKCLATKLYTYALGRGIVNDPAQMDGVALTAMADAFVKGGLKFQDLVGGVITSAPFLNRRGEGG